MKIKALLMGMLGAAALTTNAFAYRPLMPQMVGAGPGATQFVLVFNSLANLTKGDPGSTKTDVNVEYYDGHGKCWGPIGIPYYSEPYSVGAGGKNGCGQVGSPAKIISINIIPTTSYSSNNAPVYNELDNVAIDPNKIMTMVIIEQKTKPSFDPDTGKVVPGTISARIVTSTN